MTQLTCRQCNHRLLPSDRFCEACGTAAPKPSCPTCGASASQTDEEGFCTGCGFRHSQSEDQREEVLSVRLAGLSDRGLHHPTNQDAFSLVQLSAGKTVLSVCDGISSSPRAELAAQTAAIVLANEITMALGADSHESLTEPMPVPSQTLSHVIAPLAAPESAVDLRHSAKTLVIERWASGMQVILERSLQQAQREVAALSSENVEAPSTTVVSAVVEPAPSGATAQITLAWSGDSRAYWLTANGGQLLTRDHANAAQALTRWLGGDADWIRDPPELAQFQVSGPGYLLLCSDGLWKYAPDAAQMQRLLYRSGAESDRPPDAQIEVRTDTQTDAQTLAQSLVQFAKQQGGHDNITVALQAL